MNVYPVGTALLSREEARKLVSLGQQIELAQYLDLQTRNEETCEAVFVAIDKYNEYEESLFGKDPDEETI